MSDLTARMMLAKELSTPIGRLGTCLADLRRLGIKEFRPHIYEKCEKLVHQMVYILTKEIWEEESKTEDFVLDELAQNLGKQEEQRKEKIKADKELLSNWAKQNTISNINNEDKKNDDVEKNDIAKEMGALSGLYIFNKKKENSIEKLVDELNNKESPFKNPFKIGESEDE